MVSAPLRDELILALKATVEKQPFSNCRGVTEEGRRWHVVVNPLAELSMRDLPLMVSGRNHVSWALAKLVSKKTASFNARIDPNPQPPQKPVIVQS